MAVTTRIVRATGQIEWTGPTPSILDVHGNQLVGAIYDDLVQPTPAGAWGDESNDSWVQFEVSAGIPVQFGCAPIPAPDPLLPTSGATKVEVFATIAHSDITAVTPFGQMIFDSRAASLAWTDYTQLLAATNGTDGYPGTYPAPPVLADPTYVLPPDPGDPTDLVAAWINQLNSGYTYAGFYYGSPDVSAVSTCRVFEVWVVVTYSARKYPLRRHPRSDGYGLGPKRHYPPPETRRHAGGYK